MAVLLLLIFVAFVAAYLLVATIYLPRSLKVMAARHHGQVVKGALFRNPSVRFQVDGIAATLTFREGLKTDNGTTCNTRIDFNWTCPNRFRLAPEGMVAVIRKLFGAQDIEVGDYAFDCGFLIQSDPPDFVRTFLDPSTREHIRKLVCLSDVYRYDVTLDLGPAGFTVNTRQCLVGDPKLLNEFVERSMALFRRVRSLGDAQRTEFIVTIRSANGTACLICGAPLDGKIVRCRRCSTPHHVECWAYYGGCSVYGCGEHRPKKRT